MYIVNKISSFVDNPRINAFHYEMFHGSAAREGDGYPRFDAVHVPPLRITRTGRNVPSVSCPVVDFVVSSEVAVKLRQLPGVRLELVVFSKVVDIPYEAGEMHWKPEYGVHGTEYAYEVVEDCAELRVQLGSYYEVIAPRLRDVLRTDASRKWRIPVCGERIGRKEHIELGVDTLSRYSILFDVAGTVLSERAFAVLDSHLDRDYFDVQSFEIEQ